MKTRQIQAKHGQIVIHDFDKRIKNTLKLIQMELSSRNVEIIKEYDTEMVRSSLAKATRLKHLATILSLSRITKKDWDKVTKHDIDQLIYEIITKYSTTGQETNTTWDCKKVIKIFYRWLKLGSRDARIVGDPPETKHIRLKPVRNKIVREQLITEADLAALLRACLGNPRDKAFVHVHYEAGTRPGEILSLRIKHVKFDQYGAFIYVDGKTGARPIRLVRSVPDLAQWLDAHPFKDNPESPLWIILEQGRLGEPVTYWTAERILNRLTQRAMINKKINLKLFRHSEATNSAKYLTESQMRIRHGWTSSSHMPANYVHLVNSDVDHAYLKHLGIVRQEEEKPALPKMCTFCKIPNSPLSKICHSCGRPLDVETAVQLEEKTKQESLETKQILAAMAKITLAQIKAGVAQISESELELLQKQLNL